MSLKFWLLISVCISSFCSSFMSTSLNVAIPAISRDFAVSPELVTSVISAFVVAVTVCLLPASALANRIGYRSCYSLGCMASVLTSLLVVISPNFWFLFTARCLQGASSALVFCTAVAVISSNLPKKERGTAFGFQSASVYLGISLSPCLGGYLTDNLGWQAMFVISALGFLSASLTSTHIPKDQANTTYYPFLKIFIQGFAFAGVLIGLSTLSGSEHGVSVLLAGLLMLIVYLLIEKRSNHPLLPVRELIKNRLLSFQLGASMCNYMATFAFALLLSLYMQLILGFSATKAGMFLMLQPFLQCLVSPFAGRLTAFITPHALSVTGMIMSTAATILFMQLNADSGLHLMILGQVLAGIGFGLFSAPNTTIIMSAVDRSKYALAGGLQALSRNLGMASCMAVLTVILFASITVEHTSQLYTGQLQSALGLAFLLSAAFGCLGIVMCLSSYFSGRRESRPGGED